MSAGTSYGTFVVCAPGLEGLLADEVASLMSPGKPKLKLRGGGVELRASRDALWRLVHGSRLAEGVRVRVGTFTATHWQALVDGVRKLPLHAYLPRHQRPKVRVTSKKSKLYHSDAVRERVEAALGITGNSGEIGEDPPQIWVRIAHDKVTVSVDAAGAHFYRRGYRTHIGKAPLRETLAAAMARAGLRADVTPAVVWDPFCGSGTVPIEAALLRAGGWARPVGKLPALAFERWPSHAGADYGKWIETATAPTGGEPLTIIGSDHTSKEVMAARTNAAQAGLDLADDAFRVGDFEAVVDGIPEGAAIISNAPYGLRSTGKLDAAFGRLGAMLRRRVDLNPVTILVGHPRFEAATGSKWRLMGDFDNRGVKVRAMRLLR